LTNPLGALASTIPRLLRNRDKAFEESPIGGVGFAQDFTIKASNVFRSGIDCCGDALIPVPNPHVGIDAQLVDAVPGDGAAQPVSESFRIR
jgi:hypothetical protein